MSAQIEATGAVSVPMESERGSSFLFGRVFLTRTGIHFARKHFGVAVAAAVPVGVPVGVTSGVTVTVGVSPPAVAVAVAGGVAVIVAVAVPVGIPVSVGVGVMSMLVGVKVTVAVPVPPGTPAWQAPLEQVPSPVHSLKSSQDEPSLAGSH